MGQPRDPFVEWAARLDRPGTDAYDLLRPARSGGGCPDRAELVRVADQLGWPVAAVTGTASYYADLVDAPTGRRHIRVCEGTSCFASTGGTHLTALEQTLGVRRGERAADGSVSVQGVRCLGYCYASPAALDGARPRTGPDLGGLLTGPARSGSPAPVGSRAPAGPPAPSGPPPHPPGSGDPSQIPYASAVDRPVVLAGLLGTEDAWQVWPTVLAEGSPEKVIAEVDAAGLRGRGGAEFPVARKWTMTAREPAPRYVIANGDEGDPGSYGDRLLMEGDPHRILEGLALAGYAVGAAHGLVFVRSEYPAAADRLRAAVEQARAAGQLGRDVRGSGVDFDVTIVAGAGSYVAGEETALMRAVQGLRGAVRPRPPYPTSHGYLGRPTALNNVETLAAVPWVVRHGGAAYARLGHPERSGTKLVCLNELFHRPGAYEVAFGTPLREIVDGLGGGLREPYRLRSVQVGGALGGYLTPDQLDLPLLTGPLAEVGVPLGHASLIGIDAGLPATALLRHVWAFGAAESCGSCTPCRVGARRGLELAERADHPDGTAAPHGTASLLAAQEPLLAVLAAASLCAFGRGLAGTVRSLVRAYPDELGPESVTTDAPGTGRR